MVTKRLALPDAWAGIGILGLAVAWSLSAAWMHWESIAAADISIAMALMLVTVGGTLTVAGVWLGVGAVAWAMARLLGARVRFFRALFAVSAAAPPLWLAVPAAAVVLAGTGAAWDLMPLTILAAVGAAGFLITLVASLYTACGFASWQRAGACVVLTALFCASYLSLSL